MNKILICVPMKPYQARFVDFFRSLERVQVPEGFEVVKEYFPGWFPHYNRNEGVNLARKLNCSHIFFVDDDVVVPPDILVKLIAHDKDIISANMVYRCPPFNAYIYDQIDSSGRTAIKELKGRGLIEIDTIGFGAVLIKLSVFEHLDFPWFSLDEILKTDDLYFCKIIKTKTTFQIFYDLEIPVGHISQCTVFPCHENGEWVTKIVIMDSLVWTIPAAAIQSDKQWGIGQLNVPKEPNGRPTN